MYTYTHTYIYTYTHIYIYIHTHIYNVLPGYSIMPSDSEVFSSTVMAPTTNTSYASASGDYNPIHVNPYFSDLAALPNCIVHGMWTSAASRKFVEIFACDNQPQRVRDYSVTFMDMVMYIHKHKVRESKKST